MKVVILAGGKGLRLSEKTKNIPKPLVEIDNKPIIEHIISYFNKFDLNDFYIMLGYKSNLIKNTEQFIPTIPQNLKYNISKSDGSYYNSDITDSNRITIIITIYYIYLNKLLKISTIYYIYNIYNAGSKKRWNYPRSIV